MGGVENNNNNNKIHNASAQLSAPPMQKAYLGPEVCALHRKDQKKSALEAGGCSGTALGGGKAPAELWEGLLYIQTPDQSLQRPLC